jgi:large subunit ribosomal protein L21
MTSAIIETGGKQYRVTPGQLVKIEKLTADVGSTVTFDRVLAVMDGDTVELGSPMLNTTVSAEVIDHSKGKKIRVFTYKSKKRQRRTLGHRQTITTVRIAAIGTAKQEASTEKSAKAPAAKKPAVKKATAK